MSRHEEIKDQIKRQLNAMSPEQRKLWVEQSLKDPKFTNWLTQGLNQKGFRDDH